MNKTVVISGISGFIGRYVARELLMRGCNVVGIVRDRSKITDELIKKEAILIESDFSDQSTLVQKLIPAHCDVFVHLAWSGVDNASNGTTLPYEQLSNVNAACSAAQVSVSIGVTRFIFCGSDWQYKRQKKDIYKKTVYDFYVAAKKCAADMCRLISEKNSTSYFNVLPANVFGPGDYSNRSINTFILKMLKNEPLNLIDYSKLKDWVFVEDAAKAFAEIALAPDSDMYEIYVGHEVLYTFGDLVTSLKQCLGSKSELRFGQYIEDVMVDTTAIDTSSLRKLTGYSLPSNLETNFIKTCSWQTERYMKEGLL